MTIALETKKGEKEMATTAATPSRTTTTMRAFPLKYFVLAFAFTWLFWTLAALGARDVIPTLPGLTVIGTFGPLVAAVIVTAQESGRAGLRSLLSRVVRWRVAPIWYGVALLGPLVITLAAMVLEVVALGGQPPSLGLLIGELPSTLLTLLVNAVYMLIFVTLGEEVGWRGVRPSQAANGLQRPRLWRDPGLALGLVAPAGLLQPRPFLQQPALLPVHTLHRPGRDPHDLVVQLLGGQRAHGHVLPRRH
jgi:membrane protease YdiL (CAAX protease family)